MQKTLIAFEVSMDTKEKLTLLAKHRETSVSSVLRCIIKEYFDKAVIDKKA